VGICGSGVLDIVSEALQAGLIDSSGRFAEQVRDGITLAESPSGEKIVFCQKDVRELQLAKSAIYTGLQVLMERQSLKPEDIDIFYVAGGFGYNMNFQNGVRIGLFPAALQPKVKLVGNSSLGGAVKYLLSKAPEDDLRKIISLSREYSLPGDASFQTLFLENLEF